MVWGEERAQVEIELAAFCPEIRHLVSTENQLSKVSAKS